MSADRQRLVDSIRRIALTPEERRKLLGDSANRGDQAGAGAKAASQGEDEKICCDGSTARANAGTSERDPDADSQTGLDAADPARLTSGDGTLSGVTDCATGESICMDGSGHIPPEGWDDPQEPPPGSPAEYEEDVYWEAYESLINCNTGINGQRFHTCAGAKAYIDQNYDCYGTVADYWEGCVTSPPSNGLYALKKTCAVDSTLSVCTDPPPKPIWPTDGCVNLAIINGTIVGSSSDPENDGAYSTPKTSIELCDGASRILYQPLAGGGFRTIESAAGVAVTDAVGYTYSADGTLTGTITQAEWDATAP